VADVLDCRAAKQVKLAHELALAREDVASPLGAAWGQYGTLLDVLDNAPDKRDLRIKIRAALRRIVEGGPEGGIWCLFLGPGPVTDRRLAKPAQGTPRKRPSGLTRIAVVQNWLAGGGTAIT
jgi:hypothetical protein